MHAGSSLGLGEALQESTSVRVNSVFADQVGEYPRMQCFVFKAQSLRYREHYITIVMATKINY